MQGKYVNIVTPTDKTRIHKVDVTFKSAGGAPLSLFEFE